MNNSNEPVPLKYYPAYCFSVSPTFHTWVKVTAADVHALKTREGFEGQKIYFHLNHPIKWIRLVGVIVSFDDYEKRWIMLVDDSSGATLEISSAKAPAKDKDANANELGNGNGTGDSQGTSASWIGVDLSGVDVGSVVKVKGGIGEFRGVKQMTLERISVIRDTNEEARCWSELTRFRVDVLSEPWYVPPETQQRLLEEANGTKRRQEEKERRRRERKTNESERKRQDEERRTGKIRQRKRRESDMENLEGHGLREEENGQDREKRKKTATVEGGKKPHRRKHITGGSPK